MGSTHSTALEESPSTASLCSDLPLLVSHCSMKGSEGSEEQLGDSKQNWSFWRADSLSKLV